MNFRGFKVPKHLEPYFCKAIAEATDKYDKDSMRTVREIAYNLDMSIIDVTNVHIESWKILQLGIERAESAYLDDLGERQQIELKRQEWERNNTCPNCAAAESSAAQIEKETK